jgi:signal transduction histidine kinase
MPLATVVSTDVINAPHTAEALFGLSGGARFRARLTISYNVELAYVARLRDVSQSDLFNASHQREHVMNEREEPIEATECSGAFGATPAPTRLITWSMTAKSNPHEPFELESALLAKARHDLRQPLQVIQNVHDILGRGARTASELRLLRSGQSAIDQLKDQLDEVLAALGSSGTPRG